MLSYNCMPGTIPGAAKSSLKGIDPGAGKYENPTFIVNRNQ